GSIYGILLLALFLYFNSSSLLDISPYNFDQLIFWLVSQSESSKAALLGSFVTVIGFMLAYATATSNWKAELRAYLKLQAAGDIHVFFSEFSSLATDCEIYASSLARAVDTIQNGCTFDEATFLANYNLDQGKVFCQKRLRLVSMGSEVHA